MPYDTYNLLIKKLTKAGVWSLNSDELCDEFDKILEQEVQELKEQVKRIKSMARLEKDMNDEKNQEIEKLQKENEELKRKLYPIKTLTETIGCKTSPYFKMKCDNCKSTEEVRNVQDDTTKYKYLCKKCILRIL